MPLTNVEPKYLWQQFDEIRKIPRPSKKEERIRAYLLDWAKSKGFEAITDAVGNVVVRVPASPGHESAATLVIQSHMDMVCEKNDDVEFDFDNDSIQLRRDGDWLMATGTTLGADNGVGLAAGLALAEDPDVIHGPLELLVTVDEETGLTGAAGLDGAILDGRRLLNLDTEELGALYIGCAGGGDSTITLPISTANVPTGAQGINIRVTGLRGGHSGMDIIEQRGSAIKALVRILWNIGQEHAINLVRFDGGGVHNAIPREAGADCIVTSDAVDAIAHIVRNQTEEISAELGAVDPGLSVEVTTLDTMPAQMFDDATHRKVVGLLVALPHGVDTMSGAVPGLVETSNNLASVWTRDGNIVVGTSSRSSVASAIKWMRDRIRSAGELVGATVEEDNGYPGWEPNLDSEVLAITKKTYEKVFGEAPELKAVHAGLECGVIAEKCPGMDMISFGPIIEAPHSPDERCNIPSVETFWKLLKAVVAEMA